jgi:hypothetical protein
MPQVQLPPGAWTANGVVLAAANSADEPRGTTLASRPWTFIRVCRQACRTLFLRQTLYGPSETEVVEHDGYYAAAFPPVTVPCAHYPGEDAGTGMSYDTYKLWWSNDHGQIRATEHGKTLSRNCPGSNTDRWVATRTNPNAAVPAPGP